MYTVIGGNRNRTFRVLWMLEELGIKYKFLPSLPHSKQVISKNVSGKVPVLIDEETVITDSTAIITYLADKHGVHTYPSGTLKRAYQDSLTQTVLDEFESVLWTATKHTFILPKEKRFPEIKSTLKWEFQKNEKTFMLRLGSGPFLTGKKFTVPDIIFTHCLDWAVSAKFEIKEQRLKDYAEQARQRPAYKVARAL